MTWSLIINIEYLRVKTTCSDLDTGDIQEKYNKEEKTS